MWDGALVVAGPDTRAHLFARRPGARITGLRFPPGTGPLVFGVPAHELCDQRVPLADVWPERAVRMLAERVAEAPETGRVLEAVAAGRLAARAPSVTPVSGAVAELLAGGRSVTEVHRAARPRRPPRAGPDGPRAGVRGSRPWCGTPVRRRAVRHFRR
ncbi:hypothetical protein [Streptomyces abyssalis]|uniref:hypothetical protein n=1 Tax=Streptomyces abyssalis TaxID=933944 RepID=UPI0030B82E15